MPSNSFFTLFLLTTSFSAVASFEFQVGGVKGWVVPPANDSKIYNDWASENRFKAGDTVRFRYKKDSVMEVTEEEYKRCNSTQPNFFSNTGNTVFQFRRSGTFYFISGANGHCERGQRMIVKVMADDESASSSDSDKSSASSTPISTIGFLKFVSVPLALSILFESGIC
ncbi:early nodulin-like protein 1 [Benincasa hispida]|uniref:early nodulin-like protein 1 n=1 Tax=Benincasa hispida TaxID=102211 RepID=UPI0019001F70|nr:early nodulin-like protein 1 [Benincasa hispida]